MSLLRLSRARSLAAFNPSLFSTSAPRLGGGAGPAPGWSIPEGPDYHKSTYQPTSPDKHFNTSHYNYAPITLWLRARRPTMEKVLCDLWATIQGYYNATFGSLLGAWDAALPGFGLKCLGFLGVLLGYNIFAGWIIGYADAYNKIEKLRLYAIGAGLQSDGFFASESEDVESRLQEFNTKSIELEQLWEDSLAAATQSRDFSQLTNQLTPEAVSKAHSCLPLRDPISWRFSQMPYGRNHPDATTFPDNGIDTPSSSLFFWGDIGSTGDYIERVDNKLAMLKKARHLYTAAYIPPTK